METTTNPQLTRPPGRRTRVAGRLAGRRPALALPWLLLLLSLLPLLTACGSADATAEPTEAAAVPSATPTESATPVPTATPTQTPTSTATTPPTATPTETPLPSPSPTDTAVSESESTPTRIRPTSAPDETPLPTAEPIEPASAPDPLELIAKAEASMQQLETMTLRQSTSLEAAGLRQSQSQTCQVRYTQEHVYCVTETTIAFGEMEPTEEYMELLQRGERLWVRQDPDGEWEELPEEEVAQMGSLVENVSGLGDYLTTATVAGTATLDGAPVYEITFDLDIAEYLESLLGEEVGQGLSETALSAEATGQLWIGQEDFLLRRINTDMHFEVEGETVTTVSRAAYTGFDEPVEIPDPPPGN
ncbi:MAG: hypothetical protein R3248_12625 [Candidatus Promineifilaceae bacterium]|nr:hypothetical protein [Candidatus Promineifilaceae bacterium]